MKDNTFCIIKFEKGVPYMITDYDWGFLIWIQEFVIYPVHLVLHPHTTAPNFLKLDSWSPGAGFIPVISTKEINQIKKGKL